MPIIVVGVFDKDVDTVASIRYGKLYSPGVSSQFFNRKLFAVDAMRGLFSSLVLAGFSAGTNSISPFRPVHVHMNILILSRIYLNFILIKL